MANPANNGIMLLPTMFTRENGPPWDRDVILSNRMIGLPMRKLATEFYHALVKIPADWTVGTGLTFTTYITDDGATASDLGLVVRIGIAVKKIVSGTDTTDSSASLDTEATSDVTLNATTKVITATDKAVANATLDAAGAGDTILVRIRRIGTATQDTAQGAVVLLGLNVANTLT